MPPELAAGFARVGGSVDITGTGSLRDRILANVPAEAKATVLPLIDNIIRGIHEAFSIALASTFWVGIIGALIASVFVLFLHEVPMRQTMHIEEPARVSEEGSPA